MPAHSCQERRRNRNRLARSQCRNCLASRCGCSLARGVAQPPRDREYRCRCNLAHSRQGCHCRFGRSTSRLRCRNCPACRCRCNRLQTLSEGRRSQESRCRCNLRRRPTRCRKNQELRSHCSRWRCRMQGHNYRDARFRCSPVANRLRFRNCPKRRFHCSPRWAGQPRSERCQDYYHCHALPTPPTPRLERRCLSSQFQQTTASRNGHCCLQGQFQCCLKHRAHPATSD